MPSVPWAMALSGTNRLNGMDEFYKQIMKSMIRSLGSFVNVQTLKNSIIKKCSKTWKTRYSWSVGWILWKPNECLWYISEMISMQLRMKLWKRCPWLADQICGGDLLNPLRRLAENNTVDERHIKFVNVKDRIMKIVFGKTTKNLIWKHFSNLKTNEF